MILITRPIDDSKNLIEVLKRKGYKCMAEPMLAIKKLSPTISKAPIYITTSSNAESFVPPKSTHIHIPKHGKNAAELLNISPTTSPLLMAKSSICAAMLLR